MCHNDAVFRQFLSPLLMSICMSPYEYFPYESIFWLNYSGDDLQYMAEIHNNTILGIIAAETSYDNSPMFNGSHTSTTITSTSFGIYVVAKTRKFSENKVLNIVNVELIQLQLHLLPYGVTLCFSYADDDDNPQICLSEDHRRIGICVIQCHTVLK